MPNEYLLNTHKSKKLLEPILVHPDTKQPLKINWDEFVFNVESDDYYECGFHKNVPFILPRRAFSQKSSDIHQKFNSSFDYGEHYIQDAEFFDYFKDFETGVDSEEKRRLSEMIVSRIPSDASFILDVGCGNGWLSKKMVSDRVSVISMDISFRNPVEALRRNSHPAHAALIADVYHLPVRENTFDCIIASEIMEHVPDPQRFIEKLLYVLEPGGKLIITTPYNEKIQYHLCVHCNCPTPENAHLFSFNEQNIGTFLPLVVENYEYTLFSHKYLAKSRLYLMMKKFPFQIWWVIDKQINRIWRRPMRLMLEVIKN